MEQSIAPELLAGLLANHDHDTIIAYVQSQHSVDIAHALSALEPQESIALMAMLELEQQASIMDYYPTDYRIDIAEALGAERLAALMHHMSHDDRAEVVRGLSEELATQTLQVMAKAEREDIKRLVAYPEGSAGAIMTTDYVTLLPHMTIQEAIDHLRIHAPAHETVNRAYVVDKQRTLLGSIRLQTLILSSPHAVIESLMEQHTHSVEWDDPQEYVAQQISRYDVVALPVVDQHHRLIGLVTHDDAMDVMVQEITEDFYKAGTVGKMSSNVRYASSWLLYRKRIMWLVLLVFGNIFSGAGIAYFESTIASHIHLLFFLPLLVGSAGNAGSQSATLIVRALATGEIVVKDWGRMMVRELLVAGALGVTMAIAVSLIGLVRGGQQLALVVACTMMIVVMIGSLIGLSLPFLLHRLRLDPATASAPLITTLADSIGVVVYFTIAAYFL
ncbi:MAG: magnesium transporter [Alphaproteobacteria bacterium]|nr:MAG: magnesium transporter [Alphaproteobacteria bacterium]TAF14526.1 MAG: magnesium transporter [Alphaproteobacteria bacterium]TAF39182.1 MAG: magnesium transporter [Alphaproteobacteria bacterium]TAF74905.1 MAG: magnesium transporter [Alphaproteobacteria bacterium]